MPHRSADLSASAPPPPPPPHTPAFHHHAHVTGGRPHHPYPMAHLPHHYPQWIQPDPRMATMARARAPNPYPHHHHHVPHAMWHAPSPVDHMPSHPTMIHPEAPAKREAPSVEPQAEPSKRAKTQDEETAASALLMASGGPTRTTKTELIKEESTTKTTTTTTTTTLPPKRKKHLDVLRRNSVDPVTGSPCRVSPGGESSVESPNMNEKDEGLSIVTHSTMLQEASSGSYDLKDSSSSKTSSNPEVTHFPTTLHKVLSLVETQSILQWLQNGQSWKIVRWDALRREILPLYFPELCKGQAGGSIDSFLWKVRAWGFEEVKDGPDVGAYRHLSFVRGTPKLCKHMTFNEDLSPKPSDDTKTQETILRVPSLKCEQDLKQPTSDPQRIHSANTVVRSNSMHDRNSPVVNQHGWPHHSYNHVVATYHPTSPIHPHGVTSFPPPYSSRFPFRTPAAEPSPIKSGRGGSRFGAKSHRVPPERRSYAVSQRGRGRLTRVPLPSPPSSQENSLAQTRSQDSSLGKVDSAETTESPSSIYGPHLQLSVARKMKRKLPLSRKTSHAEVDTKGDDCQDEIGSESAHSAIETRPSTEESSKDEETPSTANDHIARR